MPLPLLLRAAGVAVLIDPAGSSSGLPAVVHWGADPGDLDEAARTLLAQDLVGAVPHSALDEPWSVSLLPGEADGWSGRPGLAGHRDGAAVFPRWTPLEALQVERQPDGAQQVLVDAVAPGAGLALRTTIRLEACGLLRVQHTVTNTGDDPAPFVVDALTVLLPVPDVAAELLDLTGRWCRERSPQRKPFDHGTHARESRRGRTGHDATLLLAAGTPGFGFRSGEVWATHVAWSGNHTHLAERLAEGAGRGGTGLLGGGELLLPGELRLVPGEAYTSPWVCFAYSGTGLDGITGVLNRWQRARPQHPARPRPLVLNTWEAVYFDHDHDRLVELAERAALIGVERFVLDDGWFGGRRDARAGLGDWHVSPQAWPAGLRPLADRVRALGMEFGLWFEPEMVNLDSDLVRAHPEWLLGPTGTGRPDEQARSWRHQYVLDLAVPAAWDHLLEQLGALVGEIGIAFIKWDHNRDLHESGHVGADGVRRAGVHDQTLALYRLLDALRARHPGLEIESCASGGARVDLEILQHTDRVWGSDTNDALERQLIQRWTGLLVPPELIGSHVGPPRSHTTGRTADLSMRCLTALFAHAGLEWDVTTCTPAEVAQLQGWAALYKELRGLLHTGDVVRADHPDGAALLHGVVSADRREGAFAFVQLDTRADAAPPRLRLPGLEPGLSYRVVHRPEAGPARGPMVREPAWWQRGSTFATGATLAAVGLPAPLLDPAQAVLLHVTAVGATDGDVTAVDAIAVDGSGT